MRLLFDENFNNDILRGLLLRKPDLDIVRVQDVGLSNTDDGDILEWAAEEGRILFTHDVRTMVNLAYDRVTEGKQMSGVFEVKRSLPTGLVIDEILLLVECSLPDEWDNQVLYFPFR